MSKRQRRSQSRARDAVSLIFAFFIAVLLVGIAALVIVRIGIFSQQGFKVLLDDDYYEALHEEVSEDIVYYTMPTGIDPDVAKDAFSVADIKRDTENFIVTSYAGGREFTPDIESNLIKVKGNALALMGDYTPDPENGIFDTREQIVDAYANEIKEIYIKDVSIPGMDAYINARSSYLRYYWIALVVAAIIIIVLVASIRRLHYFLHRSLRYFAYACGGAGLMCIVLPGIMLLSRWYMGLNVQPRSFYLFATSIFTHTLSYCMLFGVLYIIAVFVIVYFVSRIRAKVIKTHH